MIRIRTLGGLSASRADQPASGAATQPRRLAVLALVARAGDRGITRERLLALLWPDSEEESGRRALSQALHALRTDLHDELFLGVQELRLNLAVATCDVLDFEAAQAARDWERAVSTYAGPFLHGFRLAGAAEFDRWMEEERAHLAERHAVVLERLAGMAMEQGAPVAAVGWWRRRAALDPLNARVTVELMRALAAAGERHAALQQARIYEALVEQELALPPDAEVLRYAEELRRAPEPEPASPAPPSAPSDSPPSSPSASPPSSPPEPPGSASPPSRPSRRRPVALVLVLVLATVAVLAVIAVVAARGRRMPTPEPLLAVGAITDYRGAAEAAPLTDMLATGLARIPGLQVVSTVRLLELIAREERSPDAASYAGAARRAGATDLVEGDLHALPAGFRLELRQVGLADGKLRGAWRLEGEDLFALVDSATSAFAVGLGRGPMLGPGGTGTRSLVAWRFHEEGLRDFARGNWRSALGHFQAALREDSAFAMAAWFQARAHHNLGFAPDSAGIARLERLAAGVGDRERLQILAWAAHAFQWPVLDALADTLITRYPADIEAQFVAGSARMARAEFAAALPFLHRVLVADSGAIGRGRGRCLACEALSHLIYAYHALDSLPRAEQLARDWLRRDPEAAQAWTYLARFLSVTGRFEEAFEARREADRIAGWDAVFPVAVRLRAGEFAAADQASRALADGNDPEWAWHGSWWLAHSLRNQGRWREFDTHLAARIRLLSQDERNDDRGRRFRVLAALGLLESGHPGEAARVFDSVIRAPNDRQDGALAQNLTSWYALLAEAASGSGDAALASRAADSASAWAARAAKARERAIASYARALALLAAHDTAGAMESLRRAIYSPTLGWTRANYQLARLHLARDDPREAARILRPALQGFVDRVSLTILHELLAESYDRLGMADSARVHWTWVARALEHADPEARPRHAAALARLRVP